MDFEELTRNEAVKVNRVQITSGLGYLVKEFELYPTDEGSYRVLNTEGYHLTCFPGNLIWVSCGELNIWSWACWKPRQNMMGEYRVKRHAVSKVIAQDEYWGCGKWERKCGMTQALGLFDWVAGGATKTSEHSKRSFLCYHHCREHLLSTCYGPHTFIIQCSYEIRIIAVLKSTY